PPLTSGSWDVSSLAGVDEDKGQLYFVGNRDSVVERQLYAVPLGHPAGAGAVDGGAPSRVTTERGGHVISSNQAATGFVDGPSSLERAPKAVVRGAKGEVLGELPVKVDADLPSLGLRPLELVTLKAEGGVELVGAMLKPRKLEEGARYPAVVMVYGGP